jgi:hypothetical protein
VFIDHFLENEKVVLIVQKPPNLVVFSKFYNLVDKDLKMGYKNFINFYCEPPY